MNSNLIKNLILKLSFFLIYIKFIKIIFILYLIKASLKLIFLYFYFDV